MEPCRFASLVIWVSSVCSSAFADLDEAASPELRLFQKLFDKNRYNPAVRPRRNPQEILLVNVSFLLNYHPTIIEKNDVMLNTGSLHVIWNDDYLTWNVSDYGGLEVITVPGSLIWTPSTGIHNTKSFARENVKHLEDSLLNIKWDGVVWGEITGDFRTTCNIAVMLFPFDTQMCQIFIYNQNFESGKVLIDFYRKTKMINYSSNIQWRLMDISHSIYNQEEPDEGLVLNAAVISFTLKRASGYYTATIVCPCVLMSMLTIATFFVTPDANERISVGMSIFLAFMVFMAQLSAVIPITPDFVSLMGMYIITLLIGTTVAILSSVTVAFLLHLDLNRPPSGDDDAASATGRHSRGREAAAPKSNIEKLRTLRKATQKAGPEQGPNGAPDKHRYRRMAKIINRISFVVVAAVIFIFDIVIFGFATFF